MDGRFHSLSRTPNCTEVPIPNCSGKNNIQQGAKWIKTWIFVSNWFNSMSLFTLCIHTLVIDLSALFVLLGIKIECGLPTLIMIMYTLYRMCVCVFHGSFIHWSWCDPFGKLLWTFFPVYYRTIIINSIFPYGEPIFRLLGSTCNHSVQMPQLFVSLSQFLSLIKKRETWIFIKPLRRLTGDTVVANLTLQYPKNCKWLYHRDLVSMNRRKRKKV